MATNTTNGAYTNADVARLTTLTPAYITWYRGRKKEHDPTWDRARGQLDFRDLIELRFHIFVLRQSRISKAEVQNLYDIMTQELQTSHPFSHLDFINEIQQHVEQTSHPSARTTIDSERLDHIDSCIMRNLHGAPISWYIARDMNVRQPDHHIVVDPTLHQRNPVIVGTNITAFQVDDHFYTSESIPATAQHFGITREQAHAAINFAYCLQIAELLKRVADLTHIVGDEDEPKIVQFREQIAMLKSL